MPLTLDDYVVQIPERPVWYKRTSFLIVLAIGVFVIASVLVDLPTKVTPRADASAQTEIMREVNNDLAGCAFATQESFTIYRYLLAKTLTKENRSLAPGMLRDDQIACSLTSSSIYSLANIQPTGSSAGRSVADIARIAILWTTSDAQAAIIAIQQIYAGNATPSTYASLSQAEKLLAKDRAAAYADIRSAEASVHAPLPAPYLPALPHPQGT